MATLHGTLSFDTSLHALKQALKQAHNQQRNRILIDMLIVDGTLTTLDWYDLATRPTSNSVRFTPESPWSENPRPPTASPCAWPKISA